MLVQFFDRLSAAQPDANRSLRKTLRILRIEMEIGPWAPGVGTVVVLSVPYWNIEKDLFSSSVSTNSVDIDNPVPQEGGQVSGAIKTAFDATMCRP